MTETAGTKEWAEFNRNNDNGCPYNCLYCYAKKKACRFKRKTKETWPEPIYRPNCMKETGKVRGRIMFPTTHDIPYERIDYWYPFLLKMLQNGNDILIVTKPNFKSIQRICDNLRAYQNQIEFRFTIGTDDDETRKFWEPDAPAIHERITALFYAHDCGFRTSVSMEPLLMDEPAQLVERISPYVTETIWIGTMNHMSIKDFDNGRSMVWYDEMLRLNSLHVLQQVYESLKDHPKIRWKDTIRKKLGLQS